MSELGADIERYLRDDPVTARPASTAYRLRKFIGKNRPAVAAVAAIIIALAFGLGLSSFLLLKLNRQQAQLRGSSYVATLAAAQSDVDRSAIEEAARRVDQCPRYLRGWEWRYLNSRLDSSALTLVGRGEATRAAALAFTADGSRTFWNSGEVLNVWPAGSHIRSGQYGGFGEILAASPDSGRIVVRSYRDRQTMRILDPVSRGVIATLQGGRDERGMHGHQSERHTRGGGPERWDAGDLGCAVRPQYGPRPGGRQRGYGRRFQCQRRRRCLRRQRWLVGGVEGR